MRVQRWSVVLAVAAFVGCADRNEAAEEAAEDAAVETPPAMAPAAPAPALGDAEIAHIAVTANLLDAESGQTAKDKAQNAEVKKFAQQMITDHTNANKEANELAQRLNLTPAENATSQQLKTDHEQARNDLAGKTGAEFDRAYIAHEITVHQNVLNALDQTLIPGAQNAELRAFLEKIRPVMQAHLQLAQQIQSQLGTAQ